MLFIEMLRPPLGRYSLESRGSAALEQLSECRLLGINSPKAVGPQLMTWTALQLPAV